MKRLRKCLNAFANPTNCTNLYGFEARSFGARITRPAYTASVFVCVFFRSISISTNNTSAQYDLSALNPRLGWWAYELVEVNNRVFRPPSPNERTDERKKEFKFQHGFDVFFFFALRLRWLCASVRVASDAYVRVLHDCQRARARAHPFRHPFHNRPRFNYETCGSRAFCVCVCFGRSNSIADPRACALHSRIQNRVLACCSNIDAYVCVCISRTAHAQQSACSAQTFVEPATVTKPAPTYSLACNTNLLSSRLVRAYI